MVYVFCKDQVRENFSLLEQENILCAMCEFKDYEFYKIYKDAGINVKTGSYRLVFSRTERRY